MEISKEKYEEFVDTYDGIINEIDKICKIRGIDYDNIHEFFEDSIMLVDSVYNCGDYENVYHTISHDELNMDRDDIIRKMEEEKKLQDEKNRLRFIEQEKQRVIDQEKKDLFEFKRLKSKLKL